jgi:glycosyltransferase involved in cell wall biosynthesis
MRIGIDGLPLTEVLTGIGHYTFELAHHLAHAAAADEVEIVSPRAYLKLPGPAAAAPPANLRFIRSRVGPLARRWWSIGLPRYIARHGIEVFHGTNFEVPLRQVCPAVLTIHDLSMLSYPHTQEAKRVRRAQRRLPLMARAATMIITPTETVRREVHEHLQVSLARIVAVPEAARSCFRRVDLEQTIEPRGRLKIRDRFLLFVGTVEPRKNLMTLLRSFEMVQRTQPDLQLVVAGRKGWLVDDFFAALKRSPAAQQIILTGYLSDDDLRALYSSCTAFVYPSIYEGFGLPPLEAMACGAPVIASRVPAIEEVVGSAALLVAPENIEELAQAISGLLNSPSQREDLARRGAENAQRFSWPAVVQATQQVYVEAIERF